MEWHKQILVCTRCWASWVGSVPDAKKDETNFDCTECGHGTAQVAHIYSPEPQLRHFLALCALWNFATARIQSLWCDNCGATWDDNVRDRDIGRADFFCPQCRKKCASVIGVLEEIDKDALTDIASGRLHATVWN